MTSTFKNMTAFHGFHVIQYALNTTIMTYNAGAKNSMKILNNYLGIGNKPVNEIIAKSLDKKRIFNHKIKYDHSMVTPKKRKLDEEDDNLS